MNQTTPSFTALNWYSSKLLVGRIAAVRNDRKRRDFDDLINHTVIIDGITYRCISVERFAHSPPWKQGEPIGLLVEETL
jgi:hypothetical protein